MKLKGFSPLGVKIEQLLFMKRLTFINPAIGSIQNLDQQKILFPLTPNLIDFVSKSFTHDVMVSSIAGTSKKCTR